MLGRGWLDRGVFGCAIVAGGKSPVRGFPPQSMLAGTFGTRLGNGKIMEIEALNRMKVL